MECVKLGHPYTTNANVCIDCHGDSNLNKLLVFSFQSQLFGSQEVKLLVEEVMMQSYNIDLCVLHYTPRCNLKDPRNII